MNSTSIDTLSIFSQSCGAGALRLSLFGDKGALGEPRSFNPPFLVVGRSPDADLRLDHELVSWRHCYLQVIGGHLVSFDLDSESGVLIDGAPQRIGWVTPASRLQVGPVTIRVLDLAQDNHQGDAWDGPPVHPLSAQYARNLPTAALEIEGAGGQTYGWRMSRAMALIGRSTACQVRLMNPSISKFHAALVRTPTGVWIVDLLSREGIEVNGVNTRVARLDEGSICQVGTFTLRLCRGTLAPAPPRRSDRTRALPAPVGASSYSIEPGSDGRSVLLAAPAGGTNPLPLAQSWSSDLSANAPSNGRPGWNPAEVGIDPSQQAMMMLAQMLGTMHRDHMSLVKDELTEIRKLAEEMHALRVEITQRPAGVVAPAAAPSTSQTPLSEPGSVSGLPGSEAAGSLAGESASAVAGEESVDLGTLPPRDPKECLAIASQFLASYERKQEGHWSRILRVVTGMARGHEPGRGPLEQAPLG